MEKLLTPPAATALADLVDALLLPHRSLHTDLSLGESMDELFRCIESQRASLLSALCNDPLLVEAFPGASSDRLTTLNSLFDAIVKTPKALAPGDNLARWFSIVQKIGAGSTANNAVGLIELGVWHLLQHLDDQHYLKVARSVDLLHAALRSYVLQCRLRSQSTVLADRIVAHVLTTSPALGKFATDPTTAHLPAALAHWLDAWSNLGPVHAIKSSASFLLGFFNHVVADITLPAYHWERLLLSAELIVGQEIPRTPCAVSNAIEPLLASVPIYGLVGELLRRSRNLPLAEQQLVQVAVVQIAIDQRPQCSLAADWMRTLDVTSLHRAGWTKGAVQRFFSVQVEALRPLFERHELDALTRCAERLVRWAHAQAIADALCDAGRQRFGALAAGLVEGVADSDSRQRVARQIEALARACVLDCALTSDCRMAGALLREQVALHLNFSRDLAVWKRNKQLVADFAQFETGQGFSAEALEGVQALQALAPELEASLADQLRYPVRWVQVSAPAKADFGARPGELGILVVRWAAMHRLLGADSASAGMNRWFSNWLNAVSRPVSHASIAGAINEVLVEPGSTLPGCESLKTGFALWLRQLHACTGTRNLQFGLAQVVEDCIDFGRARYEDRLRQGLVPDLPKGVSQTWELGRLDCTWSLDKLVGVLQSGSRSAQEDFLWWWQIGVGKNIAMVPENFVRAYLQSLSDALNYSLTQEEASAIYTPVFFCYQKMFALRGQSENADLLQFSPLPLRSASWFALFGGADASHPLAAHAKTLSVSCPALLADWGLPFVAVLGQYSDESMLWLDQAPIFFGLIQSQGAAACEEAFFDWQQEAVKALPPGAAALWIGSLERGRQMLCQIAMGHALLQRADAIAHHADVLCPDVVTALKNGANPSVSLVWIMRQTAIGLMSSPPCAAALDTTRLMLFVQAAQPQMRSIHWQKIWLLVEAVLRAEPGAGFDKALMRWVPQWLMAADLVDTADSLSSQLFNSQELVFAETRGEELKWRDAISGLLAACLARDCAPIEGQSLVGQVVFNCEAFIGESPNSWAGRSQAIAGLLEGPHVQRISSALAERMAHVATLLHDRARLLEMATVSAFQRACVLLRGLPGTGSVLKARLVCKALDQRESMLSPEEAFIANLVREPLFDLSQLEQLRTVLTTGFQYIAPLQLERKKFLGREIIALNARQVWALGHMTRAMAAAAVLGERFGACAASDVAVHFVGSGAGLQAGKLALWLSSDASRAFAAAADKDLAQAALGDAIAGWRLHQARITPPKGQAIGVTAFIKDRGRLYLVGLLSHQVRRSDPPQALELLSNRLIPGEWNIAAPRLNQWIELLAQTEQQVPSPLTQAWSQLAFGTKRLAA